MKSYYNHGTYPKSLIVHFDDTLIYSDGFCILFLNLFFCFCFCFVFIIIIIIIIIIGFYVLFKNVLLISSRSFIKDWRKQETPAKNHLAIRK